MEIGRICVKLAGRDAGNVCVVVDNMEKNFVLIDGNVRRRKCNVLHLEPLDEIIDVKKGASHTDVATAFKKLKLDVWETKPKKKTEKPTKKRELVEKPAKEEKKAEVKPKAEKKPAKKSSKKE
jgi:large subunit ribosomal protein L14e